MNVRTLSPIFAVLALCVGGSVTAPSGAGLVQTAQAATFWPEPIRRVRIKARKMSMQLASDNGPQDAVATASATLRDPDTGRVLGNVALGAPFHGTAVATTQLDADALGDEVEILIDGAGVDAASIPVTLRRGKGEGVSLDGWKARVQLNPQGLGHVVVKHEDRDWSGATLTGVSIRGEHGTTALSIEGSGNSFEADVDGIEGYDEVDVTIHLYDGEGHLLSSTDGSVEVEDAAPRSNIDGLTIGDQEGRPTFTTWAVGDDPKSVSYTLRDESGEVLWASRDETPLVTQHAYAGGAVSFQDDPTGFTYSLIALAGDHFGFTEVQMRPYNDEAFGGWQYRPVFEGRGLAGFYTDGVEYFPVAYYEGETDPDAIRILFEEPFEGPEPDELEVDFGRVASWQKFTTIADVELPESWSLDIAVLAADGTPLQASTWTDTDYRGAEATEAGRTLQAATNDPWPGRIELCCLGESEDTDHR